MTVVLPIHQDARCSIGVSPCGEGAACFTVTYLARGFGGSVSADATRPAAELEVTPEALADMRKTMKDRGWVITEPLDPTPGGMRLLISTSDDAWSWRHDDCPFSLSAAGGQLTVTLAVPGLDEPTVSWILRGFKLHHFFEQLLLGPYDGRGQRRDRTPRM